MNEQFDDKTFFEMLLGLERANVEDHRGTSPSDYLYDQAESVRKGSLPSSVYVTFQGQEYGPVSASWGPLDGSKEKMTVDIRIRSGQYYKLWYFHRDVKD